MRPRWHLHAAVSKNSSDGPVIAHKGLEELKTASDILWHINSLCAQTYCFGPGASEKCSTYGTQSYDHARVGWFDMQSFDSAIVAAP